MFSPLCWQWRAGSGLARLAQRASPIAATVAAGSRIVRVLMLASPIQLQDQA
jgi:hypothetical protein